MTKKQVAKFNAYLAVIIVTDAANSIWNTLVAFVSSYGTFKDVVAALEELMQVQERIITGYAVDKKQKRTTMADLAMKVKGAVQAFASGADEALYKSVNYSRSKILYGSAATAETRAWVIYTAANAIIGDLADFGLLPIDLVNFKKAIDNFHDVISMPKAQKDQVKTATSQIKGAMKIADGILQTKLNKLMENFRFSASTFYSDYFNAERIDNAATTFTEIRAAITNNNTGDALAGVLMTITGTDKLYTAESNEQGIAAKKQVSPSLAYVVTFELDTFQPMSVNVPKLSPGELRELEVKMIPV